MKKSQKTIEPVANPEQFDLGHQTIFDVCHGTAAKRTETGNILESTTQLIEGTRRRIAFRYRWILGMNVAYDRTAYLFGRPIGHFLTSPWVKNIIGFAGLVMLGIALWRSGLLDNWLQ